MNSTLITMDPDAALAKLEAYRNERHKDAEEFSNACLEAYAALAEGTPLIELTRAIQEGGFDEQMRPRLAIAPADRMEVRFEWRSTSTVALFDASRKSSASMRTYPRLFREVDLQQHHGQFYPRGFAKTIVAYARVPAAPADVRPATGQLRDWYILWEVEQWADKPFLAEPPRDPYLLKHIGGDLYAVLAEWDLTEIERAVMRTMLHR